MSEKQKQHLYEGMYVVSAKLSEDARQKALEKIEKGIAERGGSIQKTHHMGRRRLAYEINRHKEGYYYLLYFEAPPAAIADLWHEYHLHEDLIRFITLSATQVMEKIDFKPIEIAQ